MSAVEEDGFRSGFVCLSGRPNVGKSTLVNRLVGETVSIVAPRPQTTRTRVRGIVNRTGAQLILVDTPGIHDRPRAVNQYMQKEIRAAIEEADVVLCLVEALGRGGGEPDPEDDILWRAIQGSRKPILLAINKIDRLKRREHLLPLMTRYHDMGIFTELVPLSALTGEGTQRLEEALIRHLPVGPRFFPEEMYTDQTQRALAAELIRRQVILHAEEEIPYSTAVEMERFDEIPERNLLRLSALIFVEKESQKGILIGRGGSMLRDIGTAARKDIQRVLGQRVFLELRVKVARNWSRTIRGLRSVGYST